MDVRSGVSIGHTTLAFGCSYIHLTYPELYESEKGQKKRKEENEENVIF
jgi:hypothetical protein